MTRTPQPPRTDVVFANGLKDAIERALSTDNYLIKTKGKYVVAVEYMSVENKQLRNALRKYIKDYNLGSAKAVSFFGKVAFAFEVNLVKIAEILNLGQEWVEMMFGKVLVKEIELSEKLQAEKLQGSGAGKPARTPQPPRQQPGGDEP